jgi:hypothetical protein
MGEPTESKISAWMPERDPVRIAVLGKLAEELSECAARVSRCLIQGINEVDPDTGRTNLYELERELADVAACTKLLELEFGATADASRAARKVQGFLKWHDLIDAALSEECEL